MDEVYLVYTRFVSMGRQDPAIQKLLPLEVESGMPGSESAGGLSRGNGWAEQGPAPAYFYEPGQVEILDEIIPRFTALQVYQAILESSASEHAARMVAMKNATDAASDLASALQLDYNKARQTAITNEMLDIAGGAEALAQGE
jgi:F-type H+-transporting ATPase subunit gamma